MRSQSHGRELFIQIIYKIANLFRSPKITFDNRTYMKSHMATRNAVKIIFVSTIEFKRTNRKACKQDEPLRRAN